MVKTLEALFRGYIMFDVNGKRFVRYTSAREYRLSIKRGNLIFKGFHIWKGWVGFYERFDGSIEHF